MIGDILLFFKGIILWFIRQKKELFCLHEYEEQWIAVYKYGKKCRKCGREW